MENSNKPAYPISEEMTDRIDSGITIYTGLTKREYFAGLAMQGILSGNEINRTGRKTPFSIVEMSINLADELLKQLEK